MRGSLTVDLGIDRTLRPLAPFVRLPYVAEQFVLRDSDDGTELEYGGELGTDLWALGRLWARSSRPAGRRRFEAPLPRSRQRLARLTRSLAQFKGLAI